MTKEMTVSDIMSKRLISLHPKDKLKRAKEIFKEYQIHHIPVVVMNKIVGILSQGDILYLESVVNNSFDRFIQEKRFELQTVEEVMTSPPICCQMHADVKDVLNVMLEKRINAVPILDGEELVGLVTSRDFLKILSDQFTS